MLALAAFGCLSADVAAQSAELEKQTPISDTANCIAKNLWPTQTDPVVLPDTAVFRANVTVDVRALPPPWHLTKKPGPTNPRFNAYHQEHLMMTTPEAFRTSTFYPIGVGIDPAVIVNAAKRAWRDWQTAKIRQRIAEELSALELARAATAAENGAEAKGSRP
jgi:hypothetical protein